MKAGLQHMPDPDDTAMYPSTVSPTGAIRLALGEWRNIRQLLARVVGYDLSQTLGYKKRSHCQADTKFKVVMLPFFTIEKKQARMSGWHRLCTCLLGNTPPSCQHDLGNAGAGPITPHRSC